MWASGLHLCGPAVTMMLEYVEVVMLRLWVMLKDKESGSLFRNGKLGHALRSLALFGAACLVMVWERLPPPPSAAAEGGSGGEWGWEGSVDAGGSGTDGDNITISGAGIEDAGPPMFDFDARTAGEFASGMCMLLMASAISAGAILPNIANAIESQDDFNGLQRRYYVVLSRT